jgi:hypothetical protein
MIKLLGTDELLKLPPAERLLQLTVNKYREILNDIKEPAYTPEMFEYWWNKTAVDDSEKEAVKAQLVKAGLIIQPPPAIVTWTKKEDYVNNIEGEKVYEAAIAKIRDDDEIFKEENHNKKLKVLLSFEKVRTVLGLKNLLFCIEISFDGTYGPDRVMRADISYIRVFDGWPAEITKEIEDAKKQQ